MEDVASIFQVNVHEIEFSSHQRTQLYGLLFILMNPQAGEDRGPLLPMESRVDLPKTVH